jgi:hypothetical protein
MNKKEQGLQVEYQAILDVVLNNSHIKESREEEKHPEYYKAVCKAAAGAILLINRSIEASALDDSKAGAWYREGKGLFSIRVDELAKKTGLKLPFASELKHPDSGLEQPYINIIWQLVHVQGALVPTLETQYCHGNLITSFTTDTVDDKASHQSGWTKFGKQEERSSFIDSFMKRLNQ